MAIWIRKIHRSRGHPLVKYRTSYRQAALSKDCCGALDISVGYGEGEMDFGKFPRIFLKDEHTCVCSYAKEKHRTLQITHCYLQPQDLPVKGFCSCQ